MNTNSIRSKKTSFFRQSTQTLRLYILGVPTWYCNFRKNKVCVLIFYYKLLNQIVLFPDKKANMWEWRRISINSQHAFNTLSADSVITQLCSYHWKVVRSWHPCLVFVSWQFVFAFKDDTEGFKQTKQLD